MCDPVGLMGGANGGAGSVIHVGTAWTHSAGPNNTLSSTPPIMFSTALGPGETSLGGISLNGTMAMRQCMAGLRFGATGCSCMLPSPSAPEPEKAGKVVAVHRDEAGKVVSADVALGPEVEVRADCADQALIDCETTVKASKTGRRTCVIRGRFRKAGWSTRVLAGLCDSILEKHGGTWELDPGASLCLSDKAEFTMAYKELMTESGPAPVPSKDPPTESRPSGWWRSETHVRKLKEGDERKAREAEARKLVEAASRKRRARAICVIAALLVFGGASAITAAVKRSKHCGCPAGSCQIPCGSCCAPNSCSMGADPSRSHR